MIIILTNPESNRILRSTELYQHRSCKTLCLLVFIMPKIPSLSVTFYIQSHEWHIINLMIPYWIFLKHWPTPICEDWLQQKYSIWSPDIVLLLSLTLHSSFLSLRYCLRIIIVKSRWLGLLVDSNISASWLLQLLWIKSDIRHSYKALISPI